MWIRANSVGVFCENTKIPLVSFVLLNFCGSFFIIILYKDGDEQKLAPAGMSLLLDSARALARFPTLVRAVGNRACTLVAGARNGGATATATFALAKHEITSFLGAACYLPITVFLIIRMSTKRSRRAGP